MEKKLHVSERFPLIGIWGTETLEKFSTLDGGMGHTSPGRLSLAEQ